MGGVEDEGVPRWRNSSNEKEKEEIRSLRDEERRRNEEEI